MPPGVGRGYLCWNHRPPESCRRPEPRTTWHCRASGCSEQIPGQKKEEPGPGFPQPRQRQEGQGTQWVSQSTQAESISPQIQERDPDAGNRAQQGPGPQPVSAVPHFSSRPLARASSRPFLAWSSSPHPWILVGSQVLPRVPARAAPPMGRTLTPQRTGCVGKAR